MGNMARVQQVNAIELSGLSAPVAKTQAQGKPVDQDGPLLAD
jgi:hypothetical protein